MMTYFEVRNRLRELEALQGLYREYLDFTNRFQNPSAEILRGRMRPLIPMAVDSLRRAGFGQRVVQVAKTRKGKSVKVNILRAIFRERLIEHLALDDHAPLYLLDAGVIEYRRRLWWQQLQLCNPLYWLFLGIGFLAELPFYIAGQAGFDTHAADRSVPAKAFVVLVQIGLWVVLFRFSGLTALIPFDILPR